MFCLAAILYVFFFQDCAFLQLGPVNGRFPAVDVQRDPTISSFVLLSLLVSSPCLDANEEIGLQATGSPSCWSLHPCRSSQMWVWEPSELLVAEGYWIAVGAKPIHVVDDTFCSIPTDDANCCYLDRLTFRAGIKKSQNIDDILSIFRVLGHPDMIFSN